MNNESNTPAHRITGLELKGGWIVGEKLRTGNASAYGSGGNFSISYSVSNGDKTAFLKAFDLVGTMSQSGSTIDALHELTQAYRFEARLHEICAKSSLRRVVKILESGELRLPESTSPFDVVPYLILELADGGDVRRYVAKTTFLDISIKLSFLKDVGVGLQQLHSAQIAHQDLKPSNIMIFKSYGAKIGDLGRASSQMHSSNVDTLAIAGALAYAPPEQVYGYELNDWIDRRQRCDLYHFGSLICFLFFGTPINNMIYDRLAPDLRPAQWGGSGNVTYKSALPFLQDVFLNSLIDCKPATPEWLYEPLISLIQQTANPDYEQRGSKRTSHLSRLTIGLDRIITDLNCLTNRAEIEEIRTRRKDPLTRARI